MKPYMFFTFIETGRTPDLALSEFNSHSDAIDHAVRLLRDEPLYAAVEVWDGAAEPFPVSRA